MTALAQVLKVSRATYYRWEEAKEQAPKRPGPRGPSPSLLRAMYREVARVDHKKQRTWGVATIYVKYAGQIPRRTIERAIRMARRDVNRKRRALAIRYEFVAVDLVWSGDFMKSREGGAVGRIQEEASRCALRAEHKMQWTDGATARSVEECFERHGAPYFYKTDCGGEYRSDEFRAMLRRWKVIPLPSSPAYPPYNGKHERENRTIRGWLFPMRYDRPPRQTVMESIQDSLLDHNAARPKKILGQRTPQQVYQEGRRLRLDRDLLYARWEALRAENLARKGIQGDYVEGKWGSWERIDRELTADRLAAVAVLEEFRLIRYSRDWRKEVEL